MRLGAMGSRGGFGSLGFLGGAAVPAKILMLRANGLAAKPLVAMTSPPTITMNATPNANSSVVPANYDSKYTATDPLFTYVGGVVATQASSGPPGAFWAKGAGSNFGTGNGYQGSSSVYFQTSDANVDLSFVAQNNIQCAYRISIDLFDGNGLRATALQPRTDIQALADFSGHRVKIANGSTALRGYRIEFENFLYFAGVDVSGTISQWNPGGPIILVTGDSHTAGTGASSILLGMAHRLKEALGVHNVLAQGQGGTGYLATSIAGTDTMRARIPLEITPRNPDLIIDLAGYNDQASTTTAIQAEVTAYYAALTAAMPNVPVIKVLPPRRGISTGAGFTPTQARSDAIKAAVQADSRYGRLVFLVDSWAADWEHGTGHVGATTGDGNADTWVGSDNVHRTDTGHTGWQALMGPAIRAALGITVPFTSGITAANTSNFRTTYRAGSRNVRAAFIFNSTGRGQSLGVGTSQAVNAFPMQLSTVLNSMGVNAGANNVWCDGGSWGLGQTIANFLTGDGRCSITGAWTLSGSNSPGGNAFACAAAGSMTFTPQANFDTMEVFWRDGASGRNFTAQISTDTAVAVNSSGATQLAKTSPIQKTGGVVGSYPITLTWVAGSITPLAISAYDSTRKEITVWNWGICGGTSAAMINNTDTAVGRLTCISNSLTKPDIAFVEGGVINDWRTSVASSTTYTNLTTLVQALKTAGSDVVICIPVFDNGSAGLTASQQTYVNVMYQVASENGCGVIDIRQKWQSYANAVSNGWQTNSDSVHPTTLGYTDMANVMASVILAIK